MVADEIRISIEENPYYVWHLKGITPIKKKKLDIHKSKTIFGALSIKTGKVIYHISEKQNGKEAVNLLDKVKKFKDKLYTRSKKKILFIWDNASSHKSKEVRDWLKENPNQIELDNFPPYSPEFNPIEHVWKILKSDINYLRGQSTLTEIIYKAEEFLDTNSFNYKLLGVSKSRIFK